MFHLELVFTNFKAMLCAKIDLEFETEADSTDDEYEDGLAELCKLVILQYHGRDCYRDVLQAQLTLDDVLELVKSL
jgi:hypothetical protein